MDISPWLMQREERSLASGTLGYLSLLCSVSIGFGCFVKGHHLGVEPLNYREGLGGDIVEWPGLDELG